MIDFDKTLNELDKKSQSLEESINNDEKIIEEAMKQSEAARDRQILARDSRAKIAAAREHIEEAMKAMADVSDDSDEKNKGTKTSTSTTDEEDIDSTEDTEKGIDDSDDIDNSKDGSKNTNGRRIATTVGVIVLLGALALGGYHLIKEAKSGKVKSLPTTPPATSDPLVPDTDKKSDGIGILFEDQENHEPLTTEKMEELVSEYVSKYGSQYGDVIETKDVVKFAVIANIDVLSEDNKELANKLFGEQPKEEYINDAAKLIGATVMHNYKQWEKSLSTKDFIKVSDLIYGEQSDKMLKIEDYTDRIAGAVNRNDSELVNNIVSEFIEDLNSGSLSKLDDGVGFAAQVNIALIADVIARNHLNQENFDMFQILKTSEKYVSNIFRVYEECANTEANVKTLTKTN